MKLDQENLRKGLILTIRNAQELIDEAEILLKNEKFARAYTLSHIAVEETSKCTMLLKLLSFKIWEEHIDDKKVRKRYFNHKEKLSNFNLLKILSGKNDIENLDIDIENLNNAKNDSLYVNWNNENIFTVPSDKYNSKKSTDFFNESLNYVKMLTTIILEIIKNEKRFVENTLQMKEMKSIQEIIDFEMKK